MPTRKRDMGEDPQQLKLKNQELEDELDRLVYENAVLEGRRSSLDERIERLLDQLHDRDSLIEELGKALQHETGREDAQLIPSWLVLVVMLFVFFIAIWIKL
ncbi:unnamed protein product [Discula destructiva]